MVAALHVGGRCSLGKVGGRCGAVHGRGREGGSGGRDESSHAARPLNLMRLPSLLCPLCGRCWLPVPSSVCAFPLSAVCCLFSADGWPLIAWLRFAGGIPLAGVVRLSQRRPFARLSASQRHFTTSRLTGLKKGSNQTRNDNITTQIATRHQSSDIHRAEKTIANKVID